MNTPTATIAVTRHFRCIMKPTIAQPSCVMQLKGYAEGEMLGDAYEEQVCSVAKALDVVGERWSLLIVRDVFMGKRRFDEIQADLGIARNVLDKRLTKLVDHDVLERRLYQERPPRWEYRLTEKGIDLWPTLVALMHWGDRYGSFGEPPVVLEHRGCGGAIDEHRICTACGVAVSARETRALRGPGAPPDHPLPLRDTAAPAAS